MNNLSNEEKIVPYSDNKYKINKFGEILTSEDILVKPKQTDNELFVKIDWYSGFKYYPVGNILAIAYYNVNIPIKHLNKVKAIYYDKNINNLDLTNIGYYFSDGPLEIEHYPGFYYIPYYTRYGINKQLQIVNTLSGNLVSLSRTKPNNKKNIKGGYYYGRMINDSNISLVVKRHRLVGFTFLDCSNFNKKLVINHKNGEPGDDRPDNLEWVTRKQNNQHAYDNGLFLNKLVPILVKDVKNSTIKSFNSVSECARKLNLNRSFIESRLNKSSKLYDDYLLFKRDDGSEWPVLDNKVYTSTKFQNVAVRNIFTGECIIFESAKKASEYCKVSNANILIHCNNLLNEPSMGYNFRFIDNITTFPKHSEKDLQIYKKIPYGHRGYGIIVKDKNGTEINFFESMKLACDFYKISLTSLSRKITNKKDSNGVFFHYYKLGTK